MTKNTNEDKNSKKGLKHFAKTNWSNLLVVLLFIIVVVQQIPEVFKNYESQNQKSPDFAVELLNNSSFHSTLDASRKILVFWATWCGPCQVELGRLQRMVSSGEIPAKSVLAISSFEDMETVRKAAQSRGYTFLIGTDPNGEIAQRFQVTSTPTIIFRDENNQIKWRTRGLSLSLGYRARDFLATSNADMNNQ